MTDGQLEVETSFNINPSVLIVDDDPECLQEYGELVESLGYKCSTAPDASSALKVLASDELVGIVITDLYMPGIGGLMLLEELAARFAETRPLVAVVITGAPSLDTAISAMRSNAIDLLAKPISFENLSAALRRASGRWASRAAQFQLSKFQARNAPADVTGSGTTPAALTPSKEDLQDMASYIMKSRQSRSKYFDQQLLSGPSWDILLAVAAGGLKGEPVITSSACAVTQVPLSTALRHVNQLIELGLVKRTPDPRDGRRTLLELEPRTLELMTRYFATSWLTHRGMKQA